MEFKDYLRILSGHKGMILIVTLVAWGVATVGALLKQPEYEATTLVLIRPDPDQQRMVVSGFGFGQSQEIQMKGETFTRILKSRTIAEKVAEDLGLEPDGKRSPVYPAGWKGLIRERLRRAYEYLKFGPVRETSPEEGTILEILERIRTSLVPKTSIMEITVEGGNPEEAANMANSVARVFVDHMRDVNVSEARRTREFIAERVSVAENGLQDAQEELRSLVAREGAVYPEITISHTIAEQIEFETDLKRAETDVGKLRTSIAELRQGLGQYNESLSPSMIGGENQLIYELRRRLMDLENQAIVLSADFGPRHPQTVTMRQQIEKVKADIDAEIEKIVQGALVSVNPLYDQLVSDLLNRETDLAVAMEAERGLTRILSQFPVELRRAAEKQIQWDTVVAGVKFAQSNLDSLKTQLESARISEAQQASEIEIVDPAVPPSYPSGLPRFVYSLIGLLVGLMGGVALAFALEYLDDSIRTIETVEEDLHLPVYAVIPEIGGQTALAKLRRRRKIPEAEPAVIKERLVTHFEPSSPIAEAYRSFRTNIQFAGAANEKRVLLVTSSIKGEGKTTTVANLAITIAQLGNRVALVDADMRSPMIHSVFGKRRQPGLSSFVSGELAPDDVVQPSDIENLDLVCAGPTPPNPSELLNSSRMDQILEHLRRQYDFVLFDTPPVLAVTDPAVLGSKVDGAFLVVRAGRTGKQVCGRARDLLERVGTGVVGAVINGVSATSEYGYYYRSYYHYGSDRRSA